MTPLPSRSTSLVKVPKGEDLVKIEEWLFKQLRIAQARLAAQKRLGITDRKWAGREEAFRHTIKLFQRYMKL